MVVNVLNGPSLKRKRKSHKSEKKAEKRSFTALGSKEEPYEAKRLLFRSSVYPVEQGQPRRAQLNQKNTVEPEEHGQPSEHG